MAWNPSPEVAAARDFANKFGADRVVVIYTLRDGRLGGVSYGATKTLCDETEGLMDAAYTAVERKLQAKSSAPELF